MKILGVGTDIVEITRIEEAVKSFGDRFLNRIYTERELDYCGRRKKLRHPELAVRFAAKEAYTKAIGTGLRGIHFHDIEVVNDLRGKPELFIHGQPSNTFVSLSHSQQFATAVVILCEGQKDFSYEFEKFDLFQTMDQDATKVTHFQIH